MNDLATPVTPATPPSSPWRVDLASGFLVFLIALPLCLGISMASGYPPVAGILTAILGGVVCSFLSNSQLTIKGPAAGLVVIALGAVTDLGAGDAWAGYRLALGVGVAAGLLQVGMGLCRAGRLADFFPLTVVHGMLASIGILIAVKQIHTLLGVDVKGDPLELLLAIPASLRDLNPDVACIGLVSLALLFGLRLVRLRWVRMIPAPMVVLAVAVPLGFYFDLEHRHTYLFLDREYTVDDHFLVTLPRNLAAGVTFPDLSALLTPTGWKYVVLFALIGSLESLLSARAIDLIDPWRRRTDLDRDLLAIGVANTAAAAIGGLPMISEIVRSGANVNNGAYTRRANFFHGLFLLVFVALLPGLIHRIPLAALAAMLVYTGYRLAAPAEFRRVLLIGRGQLAVFVGTILVTLVTDLLVGLAAGVAFELLLHRLSGAPVWSLVVPVMRVAEVKGKPVTIAVGGSSVFSTWLGLKRRLETVPADADAVVDLSATWLVDHTVMEKLHEVGKEFAARGRTLQVIGLNGHEPFSNHPHAARRRVLAASEA